MPANSLKTTPKVAKRLPPLLIRVVKKQRVCPNLLRLTFTASDLSRFLSVPKGAHIKLFFPRAHQVVPQLPTLGPTGPQWPPAEDKPIVRTYSLRSFCEDSNEIDIEFVVHHCQGADASENALDVKASEWAQNAKVGDEIGLAGPGGPMPLLPVGDWHILAGDLTALPAIAGILEELPPSARGVVFIEIPSLEDEVILKTPANMYVNWIVHAAGLPLLSAVQNSLLEMKSVFSGGAPSAFIAGENASTVAIRDLLRAQFSLTKKTMYAVPYWRRGQDEETYHQQRHTIMDQVY